MILWWQRYKSVYEREILELKELGLELREDFTGGKLTIFTELTIDGNKVPAQIVYPDTYPYFSPMVNAPGLDRPRHYERVFGNLCLLGRETRNWNPARTVADQLIREQLPIWEQLSKGIPEDAHLSSLDDTQAEPTIALYNYIGDCTILVPETLQISPSVQRGTLTIRFPRKPEELLGRVPFQATLLQVMDQSKNILGAFTSPLLEYYSRRFPYPLETRWIRLPEAPPLSDGVSAMEFLKREYSDLHQWIWTSARNRQGGVIGFLVPQEVRKGEPFKEGWFFLGWGIREVRS